MGMPIIDAFNPAPLGPVGGGRRSVLSVHRRRMRKDVKARIRDLRRMAAEQEAAVPSRRPIAAAEAPAPTENALLLKFTRDQLRTEAKNRGLKNYGHLNKQGLRDLLGVQES